MPLHDEIDQGPELIVRESVGSDVPYLAQRLRLEDMAEIAAATGEKPVVALGRGFADSTPCYTAEFRGKPAAMFGIIPSDLEFARFGSIWLLGTDEIGVFRKQFMRQSRAWIDRLSEGYDCIGNVVDARNLRHVLWLRRMEFHFLRKIPHYGKLGLPFYEFTKVVS